MALARGRASAVIHTLFYILWIRFSEVARLKGVFSSIKFHSGDARSHRAFQATASTVLNSLLLVAVRAIGRLMVQIDSIFGSSGSREAEQT